MSTLPAWVLSVCLLGGAPASPEELQRAVAALEKSLTPHTSLEVQFREYYDWVPAEAKQDYAKNQPAARLSISQYKPNRIFSTSALINDPTYLINKTVYDGTTTRSWRYDSKSGKPTQVHIDLGLPSRNTGLGLRNLGFLLGFVGSEDEPRLGLYVERARKNQTLSGIRTEQGLEISLGPQMVNKVFYTFTVVVDPAHDYRMTSWKQVSEEALLPDGSRRADNHSYTIEEFQSVKDEASNMMVWFPVRGRYQNWLGTFRVEVDSVRINLPIPDERFNHQEPPPGTQVSDRSGNADVRQQIEQQSLRERARLDLEGVTFDASPPQSTTARRLATAAVLFWIIAGVLWIRMRRRTAQ